MPREYNDEERKVAEGIKDHWKRHYRAWYKQLKDEGPEALDGWALNWAWDMCRHADGYQHGGWSRDQALGEAWYRMDADSRVVNEQAKREAREKKCRLTSSAHPR